MAQPRIERIIPKHLQQNVLSQETRKLIEKTGRELKEHKGDLYREYWEFDEPENQARYAGYMAANRLIKTLADPSSQITEDHIRQIWAEIEPKLEKKAGENPYRHEYIAVLHASSPLAPHDKIPQLMPKILGVLNSKHEGADAVEEAIKLHHLFIWTHPFEDGNGRTAFLLMKLKLLRSGFPLVKIEFPRGMADYSYHELANIACSKEPKPFAETVAQAIMKNK